MITTVEQALEAVKQNGFSLDDVPERLKTPSVCLAALKRSGDLGNYAIDVTDHIPENMREMIEAVENIEDLPEEMTDDEICLMAIEAGCTLENVPKQCRTKAVCLEAVKKNGFALEYVPVALKTEIEKATLN